MVLTGQKESYVRREARPNQKKSAEDDRRQRLLSGGARARSAMVCSVVATIDRNRRLTWLDGIGEWQRMLAGFEIFTCATATLAIVATVRILSGSGVANKVTRLEVYGTS